MRTANLLELHDPSHTLWQPRHGMPQVATRPSELPVRVRFRSRRDAEALESLIARAYPEARFGKGFLGSVEQLRRQLAWFPEGQWVAERADGRMVGASMCLRVDLGEAMAPHTRRQILETCVEGEQPWGNAIYGVGLAIDSEYQGQGIGKFLVQVQVEMGRVLGCSAFLWGARLAGVQAHADVSSHAYLERVRRRQLWDPCLGPFMAMGFQVLGLLERYAPDPESRGCAALLHRAI